MSTEEDPPRLHHLLQQVAATCPDLDSPGSEAAVRFRQVWKTHIDCAYSAPADRLVDLLVLNREVAALAPPTAGDYRFQALGNTARLCARLGEPLPEAGMNALADPGEAAWLPWCQGYHADPAGPIPRPDWANPSPTWRTVQQGCLLLSESADAARLAEYSRADLSDVNSPLAYVRRLVRLQLAALLIEQGAWAEALDWAGKAGLEGERLVLIAGCHQEALTPGQQTWLSRRARYRAYRARRLAERMHLLSLEAAARYWRTEQAAWQTFIDQITEEGADHGPVARHEI
jgi:hypothetical protein